MNNSWHGLLLLYLSILLVVLGELVVFVVLLPFVAPFVCFCYERTTGFGSPFSFGAVYGQYWLKGAKSSGGLGTWHSPMPPAPPTAPCVALAGSGQGKGLGRGGIGVGIIPVAAIGIWVPFGSYGSIMPHEPYYSANFSLSST